MNISPCYYPNDFDLLSIRGGGGEILKGMYDTGAANFFGGLKIKYPDLYSSELEKILTESLTDLLDIIDVNDSNLMDMHYFLFRNRIHFGRNAIDKSRWTFFYDPLMNQSLVSAALGLDSKAIYSASIIRDLLLLLEPTLLDHPFDSPAKDFRPEFIQESTFYKKSPLKNYAPEQSWQNQFKEHSCMTRAKWIDGSVFETEIDQLIEAEIRSSFDFEWFRLRVEPILAQYLLARAGPAQYLPAARRQIAKCYSLAKFVKLTS
jgi:hypothetical protein